MASVDIDPKRCCIVVPIGTVIEPECESELAKLESQGYSVKRLWGCSPVDVARNRVATEALVDGFEETLWIDSDIVFSAESVNRIRSHGIPVTAGMYAKKGRRELACHLLPGTTSVQFGKTGGLLEILYAGAGFLHVRREVYEALIACFKMMTCNQQFGSPAYPFFQPLVIKTEKGDWYLPEDFAFCHRIRQCGFSIMADTSIRLGHVGKYTYFWEDAGGSLPRFEDYTFHVSE